MEATECSGENSKEGKLDIPLVVSDRHTSSCDRTFHGSQVEGSPNAGLAWMRQCHQSDVSSSKTKTQPNFKQNPPSLGAYGVLPSAYRILSDAVRHRQSPCWNGAEVVLVCYDPIRESYVG